MPSDSDQISAATLARSRAQSRRIALSEQDLLSLQQLAKRNPALTSRVDVILASARGEPVVEIARATGLSRCSVWFWRTQFRQRGVLGIATKKSLILTDLQRDELARWRNGSNRRLQKRAMVLLEVAESGDISKAASMAGIAVTTAKRWRVVYRSGGSAALFSELKRKSPTIELTVDERRTPMEWAESSPALARKAKALLAFAAGAEIGEAADRAGVAINTVFRWRERFAARGLSGVNRKGVFTLTADQRRELEELAASAPADLANRAAVMLAVADAGNLRRVAAISNISAKCVADWKRAFERAGAAGLEHPRAAAISGTRVEISRPVTAEIRLKAAVEIYHSSQIEVRGETIRITSEQATIALSNCRSIPAEAIGCRAAAEIQWPIARESEPLVLWVGGFLTEVSAERVAIKLRRTAFKLGTPDTASGSGSADGDRSRSDEAPRT